MDTKRKIADKCTGRKQGTYWVRRATECGGGKVVSLVVEEEVYKDRKYFKTVNELLLPKDWRDVYNWILGWVAPKVWREMRARAAPENLIEIGKAREGCAPG